MTDLIRREDAVKACKELCIDGPTDALDTGRNLGIGECINALRSIPEGRGGMCSCNCGCRLASDYDAALARIKEIEHANAGLDQYGERMKESCQSWRTRAEKAEAELSEMTNAHGDADMAVQDLDTALALMRAERGRLAKIVEVVKEIMARHHKGCRSRTQLTDDLDRALAEPVEATFPSCRECGKWKQP